MKLIAQQNKKALHFLISSLKFLLETICFSIFIFSILNFCYPINIEFGYSKVFLDDKENIIFATLSKDEKWRIPLNEKDISVELKNLLTAKEDRHFDYHIGFNPFSIMRAAFKNSIRNKLTSGASTITMQLVRLTEPRKRTYLNKIIEIFRAVQIESKYSKDQILNFYLEKLPYGGNVEGLKTASYLYYGSSPDKLNLSELISLIIVPNRPNSLSLKTKDYTNLNIAVNLWKKRFFEMGLIDEKTFEELKQQNADPHWKPFIKLIPHLARRLNKEHNFRNEFKTYINSETQKSVLELLKIYSSRTKTLGIHNVSSIVIENKSNKVIAYVGSQDFNDNEHAGQIDGLTSLRSPGSTLKPLLYGLAFDKGFVTPQSILLDVPKDFNGYSPENFDKKFRGQVSCSRALQSSLNLPAVEILDQLGVDYFAKFLTSAGLKTIEKKRNELGLSLILGGCGVTPEEMLRLYSIFSNKGEMKELQYLAIGLKAQEKSQKMISDASAYMISEILSGITRPEFEDYAPYLDNHQNICWKTGTSYGRRDAWCIGYTTQHTVVVWLGNFDNSPSPELIGLDLAAPLFFQIMNHLGKNSIQTWFSVPQTLKTRIVCRESGLPPNENCNQLVSDFFIPTISPYQTCNHIKKTWVDEQEKYSFCSNCLPQNGYKQKNYRTYHPLLLDFLLSNNQILNLPPPHNPSCKHEIQTESISITNPKNGMVYFVDESNPEKFQLSSATPSITKKIFWYVNGKKVSESKPQEKPFVSLNLGINTIECLDEQGNFASVKVEVKAVK
ncbi:MAG: penicillin-binding protein 1C [Cytophagales bacterium]